jgi:hypothetical protein
VVFIKFSLAACLYVYLCAFNSGVAAGQSWIQFVLQVLLRNFKYSEKLCTRSTLLGVYLIIICFCQ